MIMYKDSGVDIEAGYESVRLMRESVNKTFRPEVMKDIGGFSGLFSLDKSKYDEPVLVSSTDGVGTKLKMAFLLDRHDTVGIDCVAMCVNDIVCTGAEPLFFLDYIAVGNNIPQKIAKIVEGVSYGCLEAGCSLIGGETAEMPGFYLEDEYDIAGFAVGIVDKKKIIDGKSIESGDVLIGLSSSGLHSNGFSLVRRVLSPNNKSIKEHMESLGCTLGEELIKPTKIYVKQILDLLSKFDIKGISNITGGGFYENLPRMYKEGLGCKIDKNSWPVSRIFEIIQTAGSIDEKMMYNTFNMGIGMVLCVSKDTVQDLLKYLDENNEEGYLIGEINNKPGVEIC